MIPAVSVEAANPPAAPLPAAGSRAMSRMDEALTRAQWQPVLFGQASRTSLLALDADWACARYVVRLHRNHGFDAVASALAPYAAWNRLAFDFRAGGYDDTLTFAEAGDGDAELVWLDTARLTGLPAPKLATWLIARLRALRAKTVNPILLAAWPLDDEAAARIADADITGVHVADLARLARELGDGWVSDGGAPAFSGSRLTNRAALLAARALGCSWLPACVCPPVKAVAVDADGTLYAGVLGEDGPQG